MSSQTTLAQLLVKVVHVPINGSFARVCYADYGSSEHAVCLALHGAAGSISDLLELVHPLTDAGFRLVIPEFPGLHV